MKYQTLSACMLAIVLLGTGNIALARDLDDFNAEERSVFCQGIWKVAKAAALSRDKGESEDVLLERLEGILNEKDYGYKYKHVMRSTVKGAYLSRKPPSQYAMESQVACNGAWQAQ